MERPPFTIRDLAQAVLSGAPEELLDAEVTTVQARVDGPAVARLQLKAEEIAANAGLANLVRESFGPHMQFENVSFYLPLGEES